MNPEVSKCPLRVLVVDDCQDIADTLATLLKILGHEVAIAYDATAALKAAAEFRPHVALLDIAMPAYDGNRVAREIRHSPDLNHIRLIACSGYADQAHKALSAEAGFDDYLVKPCLAKDLNEAIDRLGLA